MLHTLYWQTTDPKHDMTVGREEGRRVVARRSIQWNITK